MSVNNYNNLKTKKAPAQKDYESVCGLDALYFYIKVNYFDYSDFFLNYLTRGLLESEEFTLLSKDYNSQFTYFQHNANILKNSDEGICPIQKIARIGFKNLNKKDNLDSIVIQMESNVLQQFNISDIKDYFTNLFQQFALEPLKFQLSRVDINTYVFDYDFSWINYGYFSTKLKKNEPINNGNKLETFNLGSRGNGLFLRIYDKIKQLKTLEYSEGNIKEHLIGLKYLYKYKKLPDYKSLWNVELELRREQLKTYRIDTLDDLEKNVNSLFKVIFSKSIRLLEEEQDMLNNNNNRILTHSVWSHIINEYDYNGFPVVELDKEKLKEYKRDRIWLRNRLVEFLDEPSNTDFYLREKTEELLNYLDKYSDIKRLFKD